MTKDILNWIDANRDHNGMWALSFEETRQHLKHCPVIITLRENGDIHLEGLAE